MASSSKKISKGERLSMAAHKYLLKLRKNLGPSPTGSSSPSSVLEGLPKTPASWSQAAELNSPAPGWMQAEAAGSRLRPDVVVVEDRSGELGRYADPKSDVLKDSRANGTFLNPSEGAPVPSPSKNQLQGQIAQAQVQVLHGWESANGQPDGDNQIQSVPFSPTSQMPEEAVPEPAMPRFTPFSKMWATIAVAEHEEELACQVVASIRLSTDAELGLLSLSPPTQENPLSRWLVEDSAPSWSPGDSNQDVSESSMQGLSCLVHLERSLRSPPAKEQVCPQDRPTCLSPLPQPADVHTQVMASSDTADEHANPGFENPAGPADWTEQNFSNDIKGIASVPTQKSPSTPVGDQLWAGKRRKFSTPASEPFLQRRDLLADGWLGWEKEPTSARKLNFDDCVEPSRRLTYPLLEKDKGELLVYGKTTISPTWNPSKANPVAELLGGVTVAQVLGEKGGERRVEPPPQLHLDLSRFRKSGLPPKDTDNIWEEQERASPLWGSAAEHVQEKKQHKRSRLATEEWVKTSFWHWGSSNKESKKSPKENAHPKLPPRLFAATDPHPSHHRKLHNVSESETALDHYKRLVNGAPFMKICSTGGRKPRYVWCSEALDTLYWARKKGRGFTKASSMKVASLSRVLRGRDIPQANRDALVTLVGERFLDLEVPPGGNGLSRDQWAEAFRWLMLKRNASSHNMAAGILARDGGSRVYPLRA